MAGKTEFQTPNLKLQGIKLTYDMEGQQSVNLWQIFSSSKFR